MVVTPQGLALGVVDAWMWARKPKGEAAVKERVRWVEGYEIVADLAAQTPETRLVSIADREGDLRALMDTAARRGHPADWLVRAVHNRNTAAGETLWARVERTAPWARWISRCPPHRAVRRGASVKRSIGKPWYCPPARGHRRCL